MSADADADTQTIHTPIQAERYIERDTKTFNINALTITEN